MTLRAAAQEHVGRQNSVQGSGAEACAIDGDVLKSGAAQLGGDGVHHFQGEGALQLGAGDLDTGEFAVVADAELAKAKLPQALFGALDLFENFAGDRPSVFHAGGETGRGGTIPEGIAGIFGESANLLLGEADFGERREHLMLFGGALAGAVVAAVIGVHAVGDLVETEFRAELLHGFEELGFAVEAAVGVVALVLGLGELFGLDDAQRNAVVFGEGFGLLHVAAGEAGRIGKDGEHAVAEDVVCRGGEKGRIHSAGVGDHDAAEGAKAVFEGMQLGGG